MTCDDVRAWLRRDLDGAAEPSADVAEHLERCAACREEASRLKGVAATARAALPDPSVPLGFAEHVMAGLERPPADEALARAAGSRFRAWMPVAAALLLVPLFAWWWQQPTVLVEGELQTERDGRWRAADVAHQGETFGLAPGAVARAEGVTVTARTRTVLRAARPLRLLGGDCVVTAGGEPARVETPLGRIELRAHAACEVSLRGEQEEDEMTFRNMMRAAPVALAMTLLTGGATVVNAQGEAGTGQPGESVKTDGGAPELEKINREIVRTQLRLEQAMAEIAELKAALARRLPAKRVSLDVEAAPVLDLLSHLAKTAETPLDIDPRLEDRLRAKKISLAVEDMPVTEVSRAIAQQIGCSVAWKNGRLQVRAAAPAPKTDIAALREEYERTRRRLEEIEALLDRGERDSVEELVARAVQEQALLATRLKTFSDKNALDKELGRLLDLANTIHNRGVQAKRANKLTHAELLDRAQARIEEAAVLIERAMRLRRKIDAGAANADVLAAELSSIRERIDSISKINQKKTKKRNSKGAR